MDTLLNFFNVISGALWGNFMIFVLLGTGVVFTCILKFPQIRRIGDGFRLAFANFGKSGKAGKSGMSSWQSLATAIAGQVGTGNIAGPATAIMAGGPGAVFWIWIAAFLGQGTIFSEAVMAQYTKERLEDGSATGGPAYYIKRAFPNKFGKGMAGAFSVFFLFGYSMAAAMIQGNTIADSFQASFKIPVLATGIVVTIILFLVVSGGIKRIASTTSTLVPIMAVLYVICSIVILVKYGDQLPAAVGAIFKCAFSSNAAWGGFVGISVREAMRYGIARGLFSNEAGEGSTPHAHAVAKVKNPCDQGLVAMVSIVIDSFIILTMSSLVILSSGAYKGQEPGIGVIVKAFENTFGNIGLVIISVCVLFFCFSTIISAFFYGEQNFKRLFGVKSRNVYVALMLFFSVFGSIAPVPLVWAICDVGNGCMVLMNLVGLYGSLPVVYKLWRDYERGGREMDTTLNDIRNLKLNKQ